MKILLAIPTITGYHTFLHELCGRLQSKGHRVFVAASAQHLEKIDCYKEAYNCDFHSVPFPRGGSLWQHACAASGLRKLVRQIQPDLIHAHFSACAFSVYLARQSNWPPLILTIHGLRFPLLAGLNGWISKVAELRACRSAEAVWVLNDEDVQSLRSCGLRRHVQRFSSFGLGCDLVRFHPASVLEQERVRLKKELSIQDADFVVAFIGRQVHFKGFGRTVLAFLRLHQRCPQIKLLLVGVPDRMHPTGLTPSEEVQMSHHPAVLMVGWHSDVQRYLAISHLNVFPSRREGMPLNLMESLAMGVPVITLNSRGCRDIVRHELDGLVLSDDRIETIAGAIERVYRDRDLLHYLKSNALAGRERFDQERYFQEQIGIYQTWASRPGGPRS